MQLPLPKVCYPPTHVSPSCRLTFASPHHTSHVPGEVFDITCFTGINQYHCLRVEGQCTPAHLSSQHVRSVDFELMCNPEDKGGASHKEAFEAATRDKHITSLTYLASIHLAWECDKNHERITPSSFCCLQSTRQDLQRMESVQLDPQAEIVTVILDVVTDRLHFHFVKSKSSLPTEKKVMLAVTH